MEGPQPHFCPPHRSGGPHTECGLGPGGTHCRDRDRRRTAHGLAAAAGAGHHGTAATPVAHARLPRPGKGCTGNFTDCLIDRKSTRLNSSHLVISYAVFCLKKKRRHHTCVYHLTDHRGNTLKPQRASLRSHLRYDPHTPAWPLSALQLQPRAAVGPRCGMTEGQRGWKTPKWALRNPLL